MLEKSLIVAYIYPVIRNDNIYKIEYAVDSMLTRVLRYIFVVGRVLVTINTLIGDDRRIGIKEPSLYDASVGLMIYASIDSTMIHVLYSDTILITLCMI